MDQKLLLITLVFAFTSVAAVAQDISNDDVVEFSKIWESMCSNPEKQLENVMLLKSARCAYVATNAFRLCNLFIKMNDASFANKLTIVQRYLAQLEFLSEIRSVFDEALSPDWPIDPSKRQLFVVKQFFSNLNRAHQAIQSELLDKPERFLALIPVEEKLEEVFQVENCTGVPESLLENVARPEVRSIVCAIERQRRGLSDFTEQPDIFDMRDFVLTHTSKSSESFDVVEIANDFKMKIAHDCRGFERNIGQLYYSLVIKDDTFDSVPADSLLFKNLRAVAICEDIKAHEEQIASEIVKSNSQHKKSKPRLFSKFIKAARNKVGMSWRERDAM